MYSDAFFNGITMDMLALESAIIGYELDNEITDSYLASDVSYDELESANESATTDDNVAADNNFAFGFNLFEENIALSTATEGTDDGDKKPSFGDRLGGGIKSILGAIKKFFVSIQEKIKALGAKISQKMAEAKAKKNPAPPSLKEQVLAAAKEVRTNYQKAISMLDEGLRSDAIIVKNICVKINKAIAAAKVNGASKAKGDNVKNLEKINENYMKNEGSDKEIEDAEASIERCVEVRNNLAKAFDVINSSYSDFLTKVNHMSYKAEDDAASKSERLDADRGNKDTQKALKDREKNDINEAKQMQKDWNDDHKSKDSKPAAIDKDTYKGGTVAVTAAMARSIMLHEEYSGSTSIKNLIKICDSIDKVCKENATFCDSIANKADGTYDDNPNAKKAYRLCKIYFKASNTFTDISKMASELASGSCFGAGKGDIRISDPNAAKKK